MSTLFYECRTCLRIAPWTDGTVRDLDDEQDEFWCQTCGDQHPLDDLRAIDVTAIVAERCAPLVKALERHVAECVHWDATDNLAAYCPECLWAVTALRAHREREGA